MVKKPHNWNACGCFMGFAKMFCPFRIIIGFWFSDVVQVLGWNGCRVCVPIIRSSCFPELYLSCPKPDNVVFFSSSETCLFWHVFFSMDSQSGRILDSVYRVCIIQMKRKELEKRLLAKGFVLCRHGGSHDVYKRGKDEEQLPRHNEINEYLAKAIIRKWNL